MAGTEIQKSNKELLDEAREANRRTALALREQKNQAEATGLARMTIVGTGGFVAGVLSEVKVGSIMGHDITADMALIPVSLAVDLATDGQLPGGAAGKFCRVLRAAGDFEVAQNAATAGKLVATAARRALVR